MIAFVLGCWQFCGFALHILVLTVVLCPVLVCSLSSSLSSSLSTSLFRIYSEVAESFAITISIQVEIWKIPTMLTLLHFIYTTDTAHTCNQCKRCNLFASQIKSRLRFETLRLSFSAQNVMIGTRRHTIRPFGTTT